MKKRIIKKMSKMRCVSINNIDCFYIVGRHRLKSITVDDYSDYEEGYGNDGGGYGYFTIFRPEGRGKWSISYSSTADFDMCPICGSFGGCFCSEDDYEIISEKEMVGRLEADLENVHLNYEDWDAPTWDIKRRYWPATNSWD